MRHNQTVVRAANQAGSHPRFAGRGWEIQTRRMKHMNERDIKTKRSKGGGRRLAAVLATPLLLVGVATGAQLTKPGTGRLVLNSTVGFVPGQTLRVTVFNPRRVGGGGGGGGGSIKVAAPVYAASGDLLVRTAEVEIAE